MGFSNTSIQLEPTVGCTEKKNKKAQKDNIVHVFRAGESMYGISQKYGIRLKNLYKLNKMNPEDPTPKVGTILRLR